MRNGRPPPYCSHGRHVGPSPRGRETRLTVPRFISGEVAHQDERPSSLQGIQKPNNLWDTRKAIPTDHLLAAALTSSSSPSSGRDQERRSPSPNCRSQTPGPSNWVLFPQRFWSCIQQLMPSLQFPGKRQSRQEEEKLNSLPVRGYLVYLQDALSNHDYLVDTGASRSVFPHHSSAAPPPNGWWMSN